MSKQKTDKLPPLAPSRKVSSTAASVFERGLKPVHVPTKSGQEVIAEMKRLSKQDIFAGE